MPGLITTIKSLMYTYAHHCRRIFALNQSS